MKARTLIAVLVVLASAPVATAHLNPADSTDASVAPAVSSTATATGESNSDDNTNFTRLYVDADDSYLDLKPGEEETFTVRVKNGEDHELDVNPHIFTSPMAEYPIDESWVDIDGPDSLDAGEEVEYEVTISVPENAETADYSGRIAFTDETVQRDGRPPYPVHADYVRVDVWRQPTVKIVSDRYVHTQVEAGDSVTRQIVIKNTGDEAVPLSPELNTRDSRRHCYGSHCPGELDPNWIDIDAPNQIGAGETATVTVTLSPEAKADRGRYRAEIDLGLKDPNRDGRRDYWQQVDVNFVVWQQPEKAFEKGFTVTEETENVTLTLNPRRNDDSEDAEEPNFDVQFVSPDGEVRDAKRVRVSERGYVDLSGRDGGDGAYSTDGASSEYVYVLEEPAEGEWSVRIMPENTISFGYELTRNESGESEE